MVPQHMHMLLAHSVHALQLLPPTALRHRRHSTELSIIGTPDEHTDNCDTVCVRCHHYHRQHGGGDDTSLN